MIDNSASMAIVPDSEPSSDTKLAYVLSSHTDLMVAGIPA